MSLSPFCTVLRRRGRIGWSPIATDRRPNGRQNILRSGVLTISSIKLSPGRATRRRRGSGRDGSESKKHRQFVGRRGRNSAGKTLHPSFVHTSCSAHPGRRRTGTESYPLTSPRFGQRDLHAINVLLLVAPPFSKPPSPYLPCTSWIFIALRRYLRRTLRSGFAIRARCNYENRISSYGQNGSRGLAPRGEAG